jgi:predicted membrane protein
MKTITLGGIATRFLFAFALVVLTWNPSPVDFIDWATNQWSNMPPIVAFVALALVAGWAVFIHATARSLGTLGVILAMALAGTVLWTLNRYLLDLTNGTLLAWVLLTLVAAVLTVGMSWSHLRRRWSGQADVDDVDEDN